MKATTNLLVLALISFSCAAEQPALPLGLGTQSSMPPLPAGLSIPGGIEASEPDEDTDTDDDNDDALTGFWDNRIGYRTHSSNLHSQRSISESRLHLDKTFKYDSATLQSAIDFLYDTSPDASSSVSLQRGDGFIDVRKLSLSFKASTDIDIRMGRQVLTWGNGDLLFLNDFFPKDWRYWIGRDIEYSKAPSDAIKLSYYGSVFNFDLVYTPQFDADRYIDGSRLSFYDSTVNQVVGSANTISTDIPDDWFNDDEVAFRLYENINDLELAMYGYHGFYKSPSAYDPTVNSYQFSRLSSLGASLRKPVGAGILSLEMAYWSSDDDKNGTDPLISNGETRVLVGYEWEAGRKFTVGLQYYAEHMHHYDEYLQNLADPVIRLDKIHRMLTLRLTKWLMNEDLKLGLFVYHTPSGGDLYMRPEVNYRVNEQWIVEAGATVFDGDAEHQNWAQFKNNSNVFFAVRYRFGDGS